MDASLVLAIDGVRHVASTASEVILAVGRGEETSAADRGGGERIIDRATVAVLNDVETNARAILGCKATDLELAAAQAAGAASRRNVLSVFAFPLLSGLTLGASTAEDSTASAAVGITSPGTTAAVAAKQREALVALHAAITNAQLAPITDVIAVYGTDPLPPGFEKIAMSVTGVYPADLNASSGAKQCWLAIARFPNAPPITSLVVVMLELGEFIPPGFQPVRHVMTGKPANVRYGVSNSEAYLCFSRAAGAAIIDIGIAFPNGASVTPALKNILPGAVESPGAQTLGQPRPIFTGTAATLEVFQDKKKGVFDLSALMGKSGHEEVPVGYIPITHSVLRSTAGMYGGTARGHAVIVYAKDLSHIDSLASESSDNAEDIDSFLELIGSSGKVSVTDMNEKDFRRIVEAFSYASKCSPVVPLAVAKARAAQLKAANITPSSGHMRLDSDFTELHLARAGDSSATADDASGSAPRSFGDRLAGAMGKLFGISAPSTKTVDGAQASGLLSPTRTLSNLFARTKSMRDVAGPEPDAVLDNVQAGPTYSTPDKEAFATDATRRSSQASESTDDEVVPHRTGPTRGSRARSITFMEPIADTTVESPPKLTTDVATVSTTSMSPTLRARPARASPGLPDLSLSDPDRTIGTEQQTGMVRDDKTASPVDPHTGIDSPVAEEAESGRPRLQTEGMSTDFMAQQAAIAMHSLEERVAAAAVAKAQQSQSSSPPTEEATGAASDQPSSAEPANGAAAVDVQPSSPDGDMPLQHLHSGAVRSRVIAMNDDGEGTPAFAALETEEMRTKNIILFRHLSWIQSPAATRMAVSAASTTAAPDGTTTEANALIGFLAPSAASISLAPLLRALYCRQPDVVTAALQGLTTVVSAGFFMTSAVLAEYLPPGTTVPQEHALIASAAWNLLDVVIACVCDATSSILDQIQTPLMTFLVSVLHCAGAAGGASVHSSVTNDRFLPPCGLHPTTLYRILTTGFACHTFARQKRTYAERGWKWCEKAGHTTDAETFQVRCIVAKRQAGQHLAALKAMVHGLVLALERDSSTDVTISLAELASPKPMTFVNSDPSSITPGRSVFADYSDLASAFAAHSTGSASLCAEVHCSVQPHVLTRPHPASAAETSISPFDAFGTPSRSPTCDIAVLLSLLSKLATEPLSFSEDANAVASTSASSKRLTAVLHRDTAIYLLTDVFAVASSGFSASPLLIACVNRMVCPALFSHASSPRIVHPALSISETGDDDEESLSSSVAAAVALATRGDPPGVDVPPTSVFQAVIRVVSALWSARGSDENALTYGCADNIPTTIREACAREIGALMRAFVVHTLASKSAPHALRLDLLEEISSWVAAPQLLMELYINHDMYPSTACSFAHMRLLRSVFATLVSTATAKTRALVHVAAADAPLMAPFLTDSSMPFLHPDSLPSTATAGDKLIASDLWSRELLRKESATLISSIVRGLMDSAATVHLELPATGFGTGSHANRPSAGLNLVPPTPDQRHNLSPKPFAPASVKATHQHQNVLEAALLSSLPAFAKAVRKGITALQEQHFLDESAGTTSHFLRICGHEVAVPGEVGDFLGDQGRSAQDKQFQSELRDEFFGGINFAGMAFDVALRIMLTKAGFRLPGEAQKIERITAAFSLAFYNDNKPTPTMLESAGCTEEQIDAFVAHDKHIQEARLESSEPQKTKISSALPQSIASGDGRFHPTTVDVVEILSFSCIMLNTDAHNPNIKKERRMTNKQFVGNNRQIDANQTDLPKAFLEYLYNAITTNEIKMLAGAPPAGPAAQAGGTLFVEPPPGLSIVNNSSDLGSAVLSGCIIADTDVDIPVDTSLFTRKLSDTSFRWLYHLTSIAKAEDRRAAHGDAAVAPAFRPVPYQRSFSVTTVACALLDMWPHIIKLATLVLKLAPRKLSDPVPAATPPIPTPAARRVTMSLFPSFQFGSSNSLTPTTPLADSLPTASIGPCSPTENEIRKAAIDTLKYALSAALFLGLAPQIREGADALLQIEAATLGVQVAMESKTSMEGWHAIVYAFAAIRKNDEVGGVDPGSVAEAISVLHVAVAEMCEAATSKSEKATVEKVAEKFRGVIAKELAADGTNRRLIYEGDLTKVAAEGRGKHTVYRFFLFNDMLMYASQGVFGGKYAVHQKIPLGGLKISDGTAGLVAQGIHHGFKLENPVKPLVVYAATEADSRAWRRHINEALASMHAEEFSGPLSIGAKDSSRRGSVLTTFRRESEANMRPGSSNKLSAIGESDASTSAADATAVKAAPPPPPRSAVASAFRPDDHAVGLVDDDDEVEAAPAPAAAQSPAPAPATGPSPGPPPKVAPPAAPARSAESTPRVDAESPAAIPAKLPSRASRSEIFESIADLKTAFLHAVAFCRPLLSSDGGSSAPAGSRVEGSLASPSLTMGLSDNDKLAFYAYFKQATHGDCPEPKDDNDISMMAAGGHEDHSAEPYLTVTKAKRDAWRRCAAMRRRDAMRAFVLLLDKAVPGWDSVPQAALPTTT